MNLQEEKNILKTNKLTIKIIIVDLQFQSIFMVCSEWTFITLV